MDQTPTAILENQFKRKTRMLHAPRTTGAKAKRLFNAMCRLRIEIVKRRAAEFDFKRRVDRILELIEDSKEIK